MQMRIDETGHDQERPPVIDRHVVVDSLQNVGRFAGGADNTVLHNEAAILDIARGGIVTGNGRIVFKP